MSVLHWDVDYWDSGFTYANPTAVAGMGPRILAAVGTIARGIVGRSTPSASAETVTDATLGSSAESDVPRGRAQRL